MEMKRETEILKRAADAAEPHDQGFLDDATIDLEVEHRQEMAQEYVERTYDAWRGPFGLGPDPLSGIGG